MDQLVIRKCTVSDIENAPNIVEILADYAAECAIDGMPSPTPNWVLYRHLEAAGVFQFICSEIDGVLIGFIAVITTILPHYNGVTSVSESFFVLPEYRKTGAGLELRRAAEKHAKELGSAGLLISAPIGGVLAKVLERDNGYTETNRVFFKRLA